LSPEETLTLARGESAQESRVRQRKYTLHAARQHAYEWRKLGYRAL
jgi:hypothetical protein